MEVDAALPEPSVDVLRAARGAGDTSVGPWSTLAAETLGTHDGDAAADVTGAHTLGKPPTDAAQDSRPRRTPIDNNAARSVALRRMAAQFLLGHVNRKVIKQTVMTSVYGVTIMGARNQILARLKVGRGWRCRVSGSPHANVANVAGEIRGGTRRPRYRGARRQTVRLRGVPRAHHPGLTGRPLYQR